MVSLNHEWQSWLQTVNAYGQCYEYHHGSDKQTSDWQYLLMALVSLPQHSHPDQAQPYPLALEHQSEPHSA